MKEEEGEEGEEGEEEDGGEEEDLAAKACKASDRFKRIYLVSILIISLVFNDKVTSQLISEAVNSLPIDWF